MLERVDVQGLEKVFGSLKPFHDTSWLERGRQTCASVCVVRNGSAPLGSAFLVGPDLVLTAFHVVADVFAGTVDAGELRFVFDHALGPDDAPLQALEVRAAEDWQQSWSDVEKLDFALIRLDRDLGRSFLPLPAAVYAFADHPGLVIVQHPRGAPRKLAFKDDEIAIVSADGQRLYHQVPTDGGSSGSPVLSFETWGVVGLHHGWDTGRNVGIPIWLIAADARVKAAVRESIKRRPVDHHDRRAKLEHAVALLRDGRYGERVKGRRLLRETRAKDPDIPLPDDVAQLVLTQCGQGTSDEQQSAYETVHALGLDARARAVASARWLDRETPDAVCTAILQLFAEDEAGLAALCTMLESAAPDVPEMLARIEQALRCVQHHLHLGTGGQTPERLTRIASRFRAEQLASVVTAIFVDITGKPPPGFAEGRRQREPKPSTPRRLLRRWYLFASPLLVGGLVLGIKFLLDTTRRGSTPDAPTDVTTEDISDGSDDESAPNFVDDRPKAPIHDPEAVGWVALPPGDADAPRLRYRRVVSAADLPEHPPGAGTFRVHMIDVGSGLSLLVEGSDFALLYDAGTMDRTVKVATYMPYLAAVASRHQARSHCQSSSFQTTYKIDHVVLSHAHEDHFSFLPEVLRCFEVRNLWDSGYVPGSTRYRALIAALATVEHITYHTLGGPPPDRTVGSAPQAVTLPASVKWTPFGEHDAIPLGKDATLRFLAARKDGGATDVNDMSLVVRLELGGASVLLTGDAGEKVEQRLLRESPHLLDADVFQVGHHGSRRASSLAFVRAVHPRIALLSAGPKLFAGKVVTAEETLQTVNAFVGTGAKVLRTDSHDPTCDVTPLGGGSGPNGCDNWLVEIQTAPNN